MKPLIGITCVHDWAEGRHRQNDTYIRSVSKAGGIPVLLPCVRDENDILAHLQAVGGLIISGGPDADPLYFGEEPEKGLGALNPSMDAYEVSLIGHALKMNMPILGICRGEQMLNIVAGGTLIQDIASSLKTHFKHRQEAPRHYPTHRITVEDDTLLSQLLGSGETRVNSFHHQAVRDVAPGFIVNATASDGIIEGIESTEHDFALGVQWHPEGMWDEDFNYDGLFDGLVQAAKRYHERKA